MCKVALVVVPISNTQLKAHSILQLLLDNSVAS